MFSKLFAFQALIEREPYYSVIMKLCYYGLGIAGMGFLLGVAVLAIKIIKIM